MDNEMRQKQIIEEAKCFVDEEIRPYASRFDETGEVPKELIWKLAEKGYLAASFPAKYGGLELDPVYYGLLTEEIGKACCSTRALLTVHTSLVGESLLRWGTEMQKDRWLPLMASGEKLAAFALSEPEVGTDARSVQTKYVKKDGRYIINGRKKWITYGGLADYLLVIASAENGGISAFLVERNTAGVQTRPINGLLAGRATYISEILLDNVEIPEENLVGQEGGGFTYIVSTALDHGRYSIAWAGVAIAQAALEAMVLYSRKRSQFGQKICHFQHIQGIIADSTAKIHAARSVCIRAGEMRNNRNQDAVIETTIAKYFTSKIAMDVTLNAVQVHGGNGCINEYPVERLFREAKVLEIIEGTSQVLQDIISKHSLRRYYKPS